MFTRHVSRQLAAHLDGQLRPATARAIENHLRQCSRCRAERGQIQSGMAAMEHLPRVEAPETIWLSLESAAKLLEDRPRRTWTLPRWRWAVAGAVLLALALGVVWRLQRERWEVVRPGGIGWIGAGEWIETDAASRALIKVGKIGSVEVEPNTRLQVVRARPDEHRLALAKGEIAAKISAPPKLFFVDTPSGTAVDLGCEYTLNTDESGLGLLRVTRGWVSFDWHGIESLVPAGASCRTRPHAGPGIPYFDDASEKLKQALDSNAIATILAESRVRDYAHALAPALARGWFQTGNGCSIAWWR